MSDRESSGQGSGTGDALPEVGNRPDASSRSSRGRGSGTPRRRRRRVGGVVALTGIHGVLAGRLLRRLEEDDRYRRIVLLDMRAPSMPLRKAVFHKIDLTEPLADSVLADLLRTEQVETLVHLAQRETPRPRAEDAHELETVGTMYLLNAAADCISRGSPLSKLVAVTTTMVYGAAATNPNYLTESHPLRGDGEPGFVRDKVMIERQLAEFRSQHGLPVCVLRPCWTLGPRELSVAARLLARPLVLGVMGFDPLVQLLRPDDLEDALKLVVDQTYDGAFNIAGKGVLPLSVVCRVAGGAMVGVPAPLAYPMSSLLWRFYGVGPGIPLDFLRYLWVADDERATERLRFAPRYSTREVIQSFAAGR